MPVLGGCQISVAQHSGLHTFVVFNKRRRVTSSAKRSRVPGSSILAQTPDGSFRDLMSNARELLLEHCGFSAVPEVALGPTWRSLDQGRRRDL